MSAEYYMQIIKQHLKETKPNTYRQFTKEELNESTRYRAERFLEQMENSSHPMLDLEVFYEEMLTY